MDWYQNYGAGFFSAPQQLASDWINALAFDDVDGDGFDDITYYANDMIVFPGSSAGPLASVALGQALGGLETFPDVWSIHATDLDADDVPDLAFRSRSLAVVEDPMGAPLFRQVLPETEIGPATDIDGDGLADVLAFGSSVGFLRNDGAWGPDFVGVSDDLVARSFATASDVDGNGHVDVVVVAQEPDEPFRARTKIIDAPRRTGPRGSVVANV